MIARLLFPLALLLGLSSCGKHIDYIQSYYYNQKYKYYLSKKEYEKAQTAELISKENLQDHYELDSNLGIVFNLLSKNEESEKSFDEALKVIPQQFKNKETQDKALFQVYFNRGVFFQSQKKIDQALSNYQAALEIDPTSIETKHNIELLIQKQKEDQKKDGKDGKSDPNKDQKPQDGEGDKKEEDKDGSEKDKKENQGKDRKQNTKYQPRPFKGDQLSEGDVKKILGELSQQDKKIRAQFDKKEKQESGVEGKNDKDW